MGAATDFRTYDFASRDAVENAFVADCEDARHEYGHGGYTGTIAEADGIGEWRDIRFTSIEEAEEYISEHHQKWEPAMAISFLDLDGKSICWLVGGWFPQ